MRSLTKKITLVLPLVLMMSTISPNSFALEKANMVSSKKTIVNPSTPTASTKSSINKTNPSIPNPDSIFIKAYQNFLTQFKEKSKTPPNITFHISPGINPKLLNMMEQEVIAADQFWSFVRDTNRPVEVYLADDTHIDDLISNYEPTLTSQGKAGGWLEDIANRIKTVDPGLFGGGSPAYDVNNHANFMLHSGNDSQYGLGLWTQTPAHEYTHTVQRYLLGNNFSPLYDWEIEGQADYIGASFAGRNSLAAFKATWANLMNTIPNPPTGGTWDANKIANWLKSDAINTIGPRTGAASEIAYVLGSIAEEYLFANYGFQKVMNYYGDLAASIPHCMNFDASHFQECDNSRQEIFQKDFNLSLENFYQKIGNLGQIELQWGAKYKKFGTTSLLLLEKTPWATNLKTQPKPDPLSQPFAPSYYTLTAILNPLPNNDNGNTNNQNTNSDNQNSNQNNPAIPGNPLPLSNSLPINNSNPLSNLNGNPNNPTP